MATTRIEAITNGTLPEALRVLLGRPDEDRPAASGDVRSFLNYLGESRCAWEGLWALRGKTVCGVVLVLLVGGGTAVVMLPEPGRRGVEAAMLTELYEVWHSQHAPGDFYYEQALVDPRAHGAAAVLKQLHFERITRLIYLDRSVIYPWIDASAESVAEFVSVADAGEDALGRVLLASYEDSLDCPELTGLRPVEAVIAAHKSSGAYDPSLWELALVDGREAGCVLLARLPSSSAIEVVYMGVAAGMRGRGVGSALLHRALARCRAERARRLTLVVDERNTPARRLYSRFGLEPMAERDAHIRRSPASP